MNFGPQHPAAHGVLRLVLKLNNEVIEKCDPHIGLLHRGTEKLIENKIYINSLPYFDRLDYVSTLCQEHTYCLAVDKLYGKNHYTSETALTRTIFDELTRILNHLLAFSCHALDVGSMSPIFWAFEEREKIMEFYERMSGARMHTTLYRPFLKNRILNKDVNLDIIDFTSNCLITFNEMNNVLTNNKIWKIRLRNVGAYNYKTAIKYGLTGVMSRCTGLKKDVRLNKYTTYSNYYYTNFRSYYSRNGDSYDRFILRFYEMLESLNIVNQCSIKFSKKTNISYDIWSKTNSEFNTMENMIKHFKFWSEGNIVKSGLTKQSLESPKGEFSVFLISNNTNKPHRCKIRSPSYHNLQFLKYLSKNVFLADLVTLIGTIDIVFGEIDR